MNILLLGPQGSGKGTQARLLCDKFDFYYFETGKFLRDIAKTNEKVREMQAKGVLVPNKETSSYVTSFFDSKGLYDNLLLDGFPRNLEQYQVFKKWLDDKQVVLDLLLVLEISEEESVRRLSARRKDPKTGEIYNLITKKPPESINVDDLIQRSDDKPETIKKRLEIYNSQTITLIEEIKKDTKVIKIDGTRTIEEIQKELVEIVEKIKTK